MITLLSDNFKPLVVTKADLSIASIAWGFSIGFGFLTTWKAIKQTVDIQRRYGLSRLNSPYIWMIWLEIVVCLTFSVICWLHLYGIIPPSFAFFFVILTTWALQVQFLLQIIINRVSILLPDRSKARILKIGVAVLITAVNISVYCIWIPARLQISDRYEYINVIWDRCEKVIYLLVDATLNWYFIRIVQKRLVKQGLVKYDRLVRFNMWIISFSLSMDLLIIGMMSLNNSFVYMQFHPFAYIVKLNIEMSMADLIAKVSRSNKNPSDLPAILSNTTAKSSQLHKRMSSVARRRTSTSYGKREDPEKGHWASITSSEMELDEIAPSPAVSPLAVTMQREVRVSVEIERRVSEDTSTKEESEGGHRRATSGKGVEDDMKPLKAEDQERDARNEERAKRTGLEQGMGVYTKVWGP